jgi:penicillin-binding protein 1A
MKSRRQQAAAGQKVAAIKRGVYESPRKAGKKKKSSFKNFFRITGKVINVLIIIFLAFGFLGAGVLGGLVFGWIRTADPIRPEDLMLTNFTTFVYDCNGKVITQLDAINENRMYASDSEIPQYLKDAFVAIEDERFWDHPGFDLKRTIGGALSYAIAKILPGDQEYYGGSTITQQLVKNLTNDTDDSPRRKVQELWKAINLEMKLEKWQILELYMNVANMGGNTHGVKAAALKYFNKDVSELSLAECASLAGITNYPAKYAPSTTRGQENNLKRQRIILGKMLELGFITQAEYDQAISEELKFATGQASEAKETSNQSYFVDQVISDIKQVLVSKGYSEQTAINLIYNAGWKIYTTMDPDVQKAMDEVYTNDEYFPVLDEELEHPQSAMVIIDPKNGHVKAMYGGYGVKKADAIYNRAASPLMKRQPGSSFKPIAVYAPAIDTRKITAATIIDDAPAYMLGVDKGIYPNNYDHTFSGLITIRDGVRQSLNMVAAKVWNYILGADTSHEYLRRVNINRDNERYVSISMGGLNQGVNPLQMAAAYVPFVNKGVYFEPITFTRVEDKDGNIVLENKPESHIVYDEASAYIMTNILQDVVKPGGTAYPYGMIRNGDQEIIPTAGKTGTTSDNYDKWFVGYSPYYVAATWYGYDTPTTLKSAEYSQALKIWNAVMTKVHENKEPVEFEEAPGIVRKTICTASGKIPTELCYQDPRSSWQSMIREEIFIKGTEPGNNDTCDVHVKAKVCTVGKDQWGRNLLAGPDCPLSTVIEKVFIRRKTPFTPIRPQDPLPADWEYELPREYCNIHSALDNNEATWWEY